MRAISAVRLALGLALLCGCAQRTSESSVSTTSSDTTGAALRAQSVNDFDAHLAATRAHIDSLRDQITRAGLHVDAALSERLAQVEVERDTAEQRLSRLKQATQEQWSNLQGGLGTMLDSLDTRVDTLRTQLHRAATKH